MLIEMKRLARVPRKPNLKPWMFVREETPNTLHLEYDELKASCTYGIDDETGKLLIDLDLAIEK